MDEELEVGCPYCGESIGILLDPGDSTPVLIEDCSVCCRPIEFHIERDIDGAPISVSARRDDE